jgi:phenylacetate-CoA ligase
LDGEDRALPPGERGEIAVTGGFNFCLPLLRYRTGDFGALDFSGDVPLIRGLSGRAPVRFRNDKGAWLNNIDVSHALRGLPLTRFGLHQDAGGGLQLHLPTAELALAPDALAALRPLFGDQPIAVVPFAGEDKLRQYTTDLPDAAW